MEAVETHYKRKAETFLKEAASLIKIDPILGDNLCQLRAVATLLEIGSKQTEPLHMALCLLLTEITKTVIGSNDRVIRVSEPQIASRILAEFKVKDAKTVIMQSKVKLAKITLEILERKMDERLGWPWHLYAELKNWFKVPLLLETLPKCEKLPYLPFLPATMICLELALNAKIPIVVRIDRIQIRNSHSFECGTGVLCFEAQEGGYRCTKSKSLWVRAGQTTPVTSCEACLYVVMENLNVTVSDNHPNSRNKFYMRKEFQEFLEEFSNIDIIEAISACAAVHPQALEESDERRIRANQVFYSLIQKYSDISEREGFGSSLNLNKIVPKVNVPVNVLHIQCANVNEVYQQVYAERLNKIEFEILNSEEKKEVTPQVVLPRRSPNSREPDLEPILETTFAEFESLLDGRRFTKLKTLKGALCYSWNLFGLILSLKNREKAYVLVTLVPKTARLSLSDYFMLKIAKFIQVYEISSGI